VVHYFRFVSLAAALAAVNLCAAESYLVKDGASPYCIVLTSVASPSEQRAAEELQAAFKACAGVELPVVREVPADGAPMIVLGCGPVAQSLGVDPKPEDLGEQGYALKSVPPHLVIAGTPAAGTMYGVYDFIENTLGMRWYAPGVTKTPEVKELALPEADKVVRPAFAWRHTSYSWPDRDDAFTVHQRDNNGAGAADHPFGIQHQHDGRCHSYFRYVSPGEFFDTHPEYFSEIGGIRRREDTQLCLTNPDVLEIVTERMLARMAEDPTSRQHNFSQMDYYNNCECANCRAINQQYGTAGGTQFWFLNQLAERTAKVYPNKLIGTLAYMYTEEPPKDMTMHPNIAVWLCHMYPSCDSHPIATCPLNADYKHRAEAWSEICSHLYIWHYIVDFAHYYNPFPNFRAMAADMKFYHGIGVEGIYLQGASCAGGEFSLLRPYYGMKLLWNPEQDADALLQDFLQGYYGAAAGFIGQYIALLHDKVEQENIHMHLYTNPAQGYLTDAVMDQSKALFDQAEAAVAEDPELLERVKVARMPLTYARIFPRNGREIRGENLHFRGTFAPMTEVQAMYDRMQAHGFDSLREMSGEPRQLAFLAAVLSSPMQAPCLKNDFLTVHVVPFLGGRILEIVDNQSGQSVTASDVNRNLLYPFCGGEETRWGGIFSPTAFFAQYIAAARDAKLGVILLRADTDGLQVERKILLVKDAPVLDIEVKVTNPGASPREVSLRSHMNLDLGDLAASRVRFTSRDGQAMDRTMPPIVAGLREGEHYYDQTAPNGVWTFTGTKGLEVTQKFDEATTDFAWVYAYPDYLNDLETEVWFKPVTLESGQSASIKYTIEIRPMPK
jgi:hypothetical protein